MVMVETHTISAPDETWKEVFNYAKKKNKSISEVTRIAWNQLFRTYRIIDLVIVVLLSSIVVLLLGVVFL